MKENITIGQELPFEKFNAWVDNNEYWFDEVGTGEQKETVFLVSEEYGEGKRVGAFLLTQYSKDNTMVKCIEIEDEVVVVPVETREESIEKEDADLRSAAIASPHRVQRGLFDTAKKKRTKLYFACPTGKRRDGLIAEFGSDYFGACITPTSKNRITMARMPHFIDNGVYGAFSRGEKFSGEAFIKLIDEVYTSVRVGASAEPDFVVIPDIIGGGAKSLDFSMRWMDFIKGSRVENFTYYLAIQDGMKYEDVEDIVRNKRVDGLFVGGSRPWKYKTGDIWAELARKYSLPIHVGGVGVKTTVEWANSEACQFTSVDSGIPMLHPRHLWEILDMEREALGMSGRDINEALCAKAV